MVTLNNREKEILRKVKAKMNITDSGSLYVKTNTIAQAKSKASNLQRNGYKTRVVGKSVFIK